MKRMKLTEGYHTIMTEFLTRSLGVSKESATTFVQDLVQTRFKDRTVKTQASPTDGNMQIVDTSLFGLTAQHTEDVIVPSGSIYCHEGKRRSVVSKMVADQMALRKIAKKNMFKAEAAGDEAEEKRWDLIQSLIKIIMNSLPGGFGSPYNIFYDRGGYNAITSLARSMITVAYTAAEQLLGGNFPFFSEDDVTLHIILTMRECPDNDKLAAILKKYQLRIPTHDELITFYETTVRQYKPKAELPTVCAMIRRLTTEQVAYLYYYCNLKHILQENPTTAIPWINRCISTHVEQPTDALSPNAVFEVDDDLMTVAKLIANTRLKGRHLGDIVKDEPDTARWLVGLTTQMTDRFGEYAELFDVFLYRNVRMPNVLDNKRMLRNTVVISDTDSVIFTSKNWIEWFTGDTIITDQAYAISAFVIYWISKVLENELRKFSFVHGFADNALGIMAMKNEFMYPTLMLFGNKKTYAGIQAVREGAVFSEPKPDIKGANLRGSTASSTTVQFVTDLLVNDILIPAGNGPISGKRLVEKVTQFENHVKQVTLNGSHEFLKIESVQTRENYANPTSSAYFNWMAWDAIFAPKYGEVAIPTKGPVLPLLRVTSDYLAWLEQQDADIHRRMKLFIEQHKRMSNFLVLNRTLEVLPPEIEPLIDIRAIVYHNARAAHLVLNELRIGCGRSSHKLLFSDLYTAESV